MFCFKRIHNDQFNLANTETLCNQCLFAALLTVLIVYCCSRCTVRTFNSYMPPASVHCTGVNPFKVTVNLKISIRDSNWNLNPIIVDGSLKCVLFFAVLARGAQ